MEENDIKELNDSNDEEINVNDNINDNINNEYNEVYEPIEEEDQNNLALINRMQNNIPSEEVKRNELINNQLKNIIKSDYDE